MSQGHTGGHQAPACWTPAALRPQGHSHGIQLSLPLSKVDRSPRQLPAALASSAPLQDTQPGQCCARGGERTPLAPRGTPRRGMPGHFPEPVCSLRSWGTVLFWGAPHAPLAGGVQGTCASFLGSPSWSSPARTWGGAVLHRCSSRTHARIDRLHLWDLP